MNMEHFSTYQLVSAFNHSDFRRKVIPQELVSGWPCVQKIGRTLCITIPYYARRIEKNRIALFPLYCSVTFPLGNQNRLLDFTTYPHHKEWCDIDYTKPAGYFKHKALEDVKSKDEYQAMCKELYGYYDQMITAILNKKPFEQEDEMIVLFSKLMEPGHYEQYQRINKKFYSYFCKG